MITGLTAYIRNRLQEPPRRVRFSPLAGTVENMEPRRSRQTERLLLDPRSRLSDVTTHEPLAAPEVEAAAPPGTLSPGYWGYAITCLGVRRVWITSVFDARIVELHSAAVRRYHGTGEDSELREFDGVEVDDHKLVSSGVEVERLAAAMRRRADV
jgi:hypothetical protein